MTQPGFLDWTLLRSGRIPSALYSEKDLKELTEFVLKAERVGGPVSVTLDLTSHERIHRLNRHFRGVDRTTDVISFRYIPDVVDPPPTKKKVGELAGDLAINVVQAALQAKKVRHSTKREIQVLLIHGLLHFLEYTDYEPHHRRRMFKRQNELLRRWENRRPAEK